MPANTQSEAGTSIASGSEGASGAFQIATFQSAHARYAETTRTNQHSVMSAGWL